MTLSNRPENKAMFHSAIQSGDLTYAPIRKRLEPEALVREHRDMVRRIAWHVYGGVSSKVELEDLIQIGLVALVESAQTFEERGASFKAYAATRVRGAMIDQLRREATISRNGMVNRRKLATTRKSLESQHGRSIGDAEMAAALGLCPEAYFAMVQSAQSMEQESIGEVYQDDQTWFADLRDGPADELEHAELRLAVASAIGELPEREAMVLQLYFVEECNLEEIGAVLDIGAARVCQLKKAALAKVRTKLAT
jgi:RNA polymerase sigma factor for flagellar operon FliA